MNKFEAMSSVKKLINQERYQFAHMTYLNNSKGLVEVAKLDTLHLRFKIGEPLKEIQMSVTFCDKYFDLLAFPSPIMVDEKFSLSTIRFINFLNSYLKMGNGRFYLDQETMDVAISVRIPYYFLQAFPLESVDKSIIGSIEFYIDVGYSLYQVSNGCMTVEVACDYMNRVWA